MRKLILTILPALALTALPAFAQESVTSSTSTTVDAPAASETVTKKVTRTDEGTPLVADRESRTYERKTTSDGLNSSTEIDKHKTVEGTDGSSFSESRSQTSTTGPQ